MELLRVHLPVDPDLYAFTRLALEVVDRLGASAFQAARRVVPILNALRQAGAGRGLPVAASLELQGREILVRWQDGCEALAQLGERPSPQRLAELSEHYRRATEASDPDLLLARNQRMMQYLEESRSRMEAELARLQQDLDQRQEELWQRMREAETDALTGLLNRRAFDDRFGKAFRRTARQRGESLSLLLLDLDFFKEVNDQYGHQFGDAYLNKMAHAMLDVVREDVDMAFRIGGDEFAMVLFADRRTACRKGLDVLETMGGKVSIGVATLEGGSGDEDHEAFFRSADEALYAAKEGGRGRVVAAGCAQVDDGGCLVVCAS